jgi:hypothetical protein
VMRALTVRRVLGIVARDERRRRDARHGHPQIDPVPEGTRNTPRVPVDLRDRAMAAVLRIGAREPARARVHRSDQLEARRERHDAPGPGDEDATLLERLAEAPRGRPGRIRQLVEEKQRRRAHG